MINTSLDLNLSLSILYFHFSVSSLTFSPLCPGSGPITENSSLLLSSTGDVAEQYVLERNGSYNGHPMWQQRDMAGQGVYYYLYFTSMWVIGFTLIRNNQTSDLPPISGKIFPAFSNTQ